MDRLSPLWAAGKCAVQTTPLAVCVLLSVLCTAFWMRSFSAGDRFVYRPSSVQNGQAVTSEFYLQSAAGGFRFTYTRLASSSAEEVADFTGARGRGLAPAGFSSYENPSYPRTQGAREDSALTALGIHFVMFRDRPNEALARDTGLLILPWWLLVVLFAAYPTTKYVTCVVRRQQEDRIALGLCPRCGVPVNEMVSACQGCDRPVGMLTHA